MQRQLNVLLIDDNPEDIRCARETLEASGHLENLHVIEDGEKAMDYLTALEEASMPDVILLDLYLPKKTGLELMDFIKREPKFKAARVVIVTSSTADEEFFKSFKLPADGCVQKPFDQEELRRVVDILAEEATAA
jgi:CheY-like chemotaxis protein